MSTSELNYLGSITETDRESFINKLSELILTLREDPAPLTKLVDRLIQPECFTFTRVLAIRPAIDFVAGLQVPSRDLKLTTLHLLDKAGRKESYADIIAAMPELVTALIELWLCSQETAVANLAHQVLLGLLKPGEIQAPSETYSHSLMWRRMFRDRDVYSLILSLCSLTPNGQVHQPTKKEKSISQGRLFDLLVHIDCEMIRSTHFPHMEGRYGIGDGGLLEFATLHMVDCKEDVLMEVTLVDFLAKYLSNGSSESLDFLIRKGLHSRVLSYYREAGAYKSSSSSYLYGAAAYYLTVYCCKFGAHLSEDRLVLNCILTQLTLVFGRVFENRMSQNMTFQHDLRLLAVLPRVTIIPQSFQNSPLFLINRKPIRADVYKTMAVIFRGNNEPSVAISSRENAAARALYFLYIKQFPLFWKEVVEAADNVVLKDLALAAIGLIKTILTARWEPLPTTAVPSSQDSLTLPTEEELARKCTDSTMLLPPSGVLAILANPTVETVIPYLLRPAKTFSSHRLGGIGDTENVAYQVAVAKHDLVVVFHQKMKTISPESEGDGERLQEMIMEIGRRVAQGPMGVASQAGSMIATMGR